MKLTVGGIEVELVLKRIRNMHLHIKPPMGEVEVTAPYGTPQAAVVRFVSAHIGWVVEKRSAMQARNEAGFAFRGVSMRFSTSTGPRYGVSVDGGDFVFTARAGSSEDQRRRWLSNWLRDDLKSRIPALIRKWEAATGLHPSGWSVRDMKTRWGTCNTRTGMIWFSLQLSRMSDECLDYVVLHEMAHLAVPNHGPAFKAILDRYMPTWRDTRRSLNG